jgi:dTDP-4-amino-4,6-dideoxygalactose transaminase
MKPKIWLSSPHMGGNERQFVNEAFETNWVAPLGPNVDGFEKDIASYLNDGVYVAALSSGTAAIHLALILLGVEANDEVVCQSMTFSASANPVVYLGAKTIFIDSEKETWNMDPGVLEEAIKDRLKKGKKPKAIIAVHLYGMPAKMDEITSIAEKYEIPVIEDAAEALGSSIQGKKCGTFGEISILSFNGNKIITTSGGGALVSKNKEQVKTGTFRMSNICAGIGRGQMQVLAERVGQRRNNYEFYKNTFAQLEGFTFLNEPDGYYSNRWLTTVLIDPARTTTGISREDIRLALEKENIECRPLWKPMHLQPVFSNAIYFGKSVAEELFNTGLCLPSGSNLSQKDVERVAENITKLVE